MLHRLALPYLFATLISLFFLIPQLALSAEFSGLGDLPGGVDTEIQGTVFGPEHSRAYGVSADGNVAVGLSISAPGKEAFKWTNGGGIVGLGDLPGGIFDSRAAAASFDGSVIVGGSLGTAGPEAFHWTQVGGIVGIGLLRGTTASMATDVSADGSVIVGISGGTSSNPSIPYSIFSGQAFRWTQADGMVGLGSLSAGSQSGAYGVSEDGTVVVGLSETAEGIQVFRWTMAGGMMGLGLLPDATGSLALDVSSDGLVVVGYSGGNDIEAFRWTASSGMQGLGYLEGGAYSPQSIALSTSGDGSVVVGYSSSDKGYEAFIWTADQGMQSLNAYLVANGIDMTGWFLSEARGISDDGTVIVGIVYNPVGNIEAWIVELNSGPTTKTLNLSVSGEGIVYSEPGNDMQCTGVCSEEYLEGTFVTLTANPANNYSFAGWTGDCTGNGDCIVAMDSAQNVTATFLEIVPNPVILEGLPGSFTTIQYVYDSITSRKFATIKVKAGPHASESLMFDRDVTIRLIGGYDEIFTNIDGVTSFYWLVDNL